MQKQTEFHPVDLARAYVHFTLSANYWYNKAFGKFPASSLCLSRAEWYDRRAMRCLHSLSDAYQTIARCFYHAAYSNKRTPFDYPLPLDFDVKE